MGCVGITVVQKLIQTYTLQDICIFVFKNIGLTFFN